jgi:subtilisin family serine protease
MKFFRKVMPAAVAGAVLAMSAASVCAQGAPGERAIRYAKGRILVQPRAGLPDGELDKILKTHGAKRGKHVKQINLHVVELPEQANEAAVVKALSRNRHIKFAELDQVVEPDATANDTYFGNAWHLPKIRATTAWDTSVGEAVTIAILDSGVDANHPDLQPQLVPGWNFYDNTADTTDVFGHGTQVAGVAAAAGNNGIGVTGVTWKAKVMPIRITDTQGYGYFSMMAQGITYAADRGARVANISFRGVAGSSAVSSAAQYMRSKGGVVVVAAGNTGVQEAFLADSNIVAVSATDSSDTKTSWSSYGAYVDVAAPGVGLWTTTRGGGYGAASGTSVASPATAGVYALMISANPLLSATALDTALFSTALDLGTAGFDNLYGHGRIDAGAAVAKARTTVASDTQAPSVSIAAPTGGRVEGVVGVDVAATDNVAVARVELYAGNKLVATDTTAPYAFAWDTSSMTDGSTTLQARAYDTAGNTAASSPVSVTVSNDTVAPTVTISNPANGSTVSGTVAVNVSAADNKQVAKISLLIDGKEVAVSYGSTLSYSWDTASGSTTNTKRGGPKRQSGTTSTSGGQSTITARASDPSGNQASTSVTVTRQ